MEGEFNYSGKTAIESLQELCILRKYPQPLFLDRSQSNKIQVTAVVGGKIYGSAEGKTLVEACEHAATTTLSIWLKDKFDPQLLRKPSPPPNEDAPKVKTAPTAATPPTMTNSSISESQLNAVSLLHVFASSILYDPASKPEYDVSRVDDKFVCNLTVVHKFKTYKTGGEGKTKGLLIISFTFDILTLTVLSIGKESSCLGDVTVRHLHLPSLSYLTLEISILIYTLLSKCQKL
jgi:hypothetical protein